MLRGIRLWVVVGELLAVVCFSAVHRASRITPAMPRGGLVQEGNTCFLGATMQALFEADSFEDSASPSETHESY